MITRCAGCHQAFHRNREKSASSPIIPGQGRILRRRAEQRRCSCRFHARRKGVCSGSRTRRACSDCCVHTQFLTSSNFFMFFTQADSQYVQKGRGDIGPRKHANTRWRLHRCRVARGLDFDLVACRGRSVLLIRGRSICHKRSHWEIRCRNFELIAVTAGNNGS